MKAYKTHQASATTTTADTLITHLKSVRTDSCLVMSKPMRMLPEGWRRFLKNRPSWLLLSDSLFRRFRVCANFSAGVGRMITIKTQYQTNTYIVH